MEADTN